MEIDDQPPRWTVGIAGLVLLLAGGLAWRLHQKKAAAAGVTSSRAVLSIAGVPVKSRVPRKEQPEVAFDVVLAQAPVGSSLPLDCDWLGPARDVRYQNHWETRDIDKALWPTHCRRRFTLADPAGQWWVRMRLADRELVTQRFELE